MLPVRRSNNSNKVACTYSLPRMKTKNLTCTFCKHNFFMREYTSCTRYLQNRPPLLLDCGHSVCNNCLTSVPKRTCSLCPQTTQDTEETKESSPSLNVYLAGLLLMSPNTSATVDEPNMSFQQSHSSRQRSSLSFDYCQECGRQATIKCRQCLILLCQGCFSKIHGRALQNHERILLSKERNKNDSFTNISHVCSDTCEQFIEFYCIECEKLLCAHCTLYSHSKHDTMPLSQKNEELLPDLYAVYDRVADNLQRVHQAQKKLQDNVTARMETQFGDIEAKVVQHFLHLHGVLQCIEKHIIDKLCKQYDQFKSNINMTAALLKDQEEQMRSTLQTAVYAKENLHCVEMQKVIHKLEELADIPCHLVLEEPSKETMISFEVDNAIATALKNHCTFQVPTGPDFRLVRTEDLPENYTVEPLTQRMNIPSIANTPVQVLAPKQALPVANVSPCKSKKRNSDTGAMEYVHVTHVNDPFCFYVQRASFEKEGTELERKLMAYANDTSIQRRSPPIITKNKLYIVQYSSDGHWYRGRVVGARINSDNERFHDIFYIDYGMEEKSVPAERIRDLPVQFSFLPPLAIKCALHDIVPMDGKWQPDAIEYFLKIVHSNPSLMMHIVNTSDDTHYVELILQSSDVQAVSSVKDSLIFMKHGNYVSWHNLTRMNPHSVYQLHTEELQLDTFTDVIMLWAESPDCIYVAKYSTAVDTYTRKIMDDMEKEYKEDNLSKGVIYVPEQNQPCAAQGVDGRWYRAIITKILNEREVRVFFVDAGYWLIVSYDKLRRLSHKYIAQKTQAIKVSLKDIRPRVEDHGKWCREAIDFVKMNLMGPMPIKVFPLEKIGDAYSVRLYDQENNNLGLQLVEHNLAREVSGSTQAALFRGKNKRRGKYKKTSLQISCPSYIKGNLDYDSNVLKSPPQNEGDPFKVRVVIQKVISPDCIYVMDATRSTLQEAVLTQIQEFYNKYHSKVSYEKWKENDICVAYSSKDKMYLRARILQIHSQDKVDLFFYDIGIEETTAMENMQPLHPSFSNIPAFVFKVRMAGILPCGGSSKWPSLSCEKLSDIVNENQNREFYISKAESDSKQQLDGICVELWLKETRTDGPLSPTKTEITSINRMLIEHGVALPIKGYTANQNKILAIDFKRELESCEETADDVGIKWVTLGAEDLSPGLIIEEVNADSEYEDVHSGDDSAQLRAWIPPVPIKEETFIGIPTYLDNDAVLYLHSRKDSARILQKIERKLENICKDIPTRRCRKWKKGDLCIAQYHGNKKWYRGVAEEVKEDGIILVKFVDYGNSEECDTDTVLKKTVLNQIPIQCTKCIVQGLEPATEDGKWKIDDLDRIHATVVEKPCEITVLERQDTHLVISVTILTPRKCDLISYITEELDIRVGKWEETLAETASTTGTSITDYADVVVEGTIDLSETNTNLKTLETPETVAEVLLSGNSASLKNKSASTTNSNSQDELTDDADNVSWKNWPKSMLISSTPQTQSEENISGKYTPVEIPNDIDVLEILLCDTAGAVPIEYYVQLHKNHQSKILKSYWMQYNRLMADLQRAAYKQPMIKTLTTGTPCCAQFSLDGLWYRCLITKSVVVEEMQVKVELRYVDFGNTEDRVIDPEESGLYSLKTEWLTVPTAAFKCRLWNVTPTADINFMDLALKLSELCERTAIARIKDRNDDVIIAELFSNFECTELLYNSLIEDGWLCLDEVDN